jgi:hypothetical protein
MKRLFVFALLVVSARYGWSHRDALFSRPERNDAIVENDASCSIERLRLTVDGRTLVKEWLPSHETAVIPFEVDNDSDFELVWQWSGRTVERHWHGGMVARGSMPGRHVFQIDDDGNVRYYTERKSAAQL